MKSTTDLTTIEVQLSNRLITTPADVELDDASITLTVYAPIPNEVGRAEMHRFAIELAGSALQFVERSPLGSKPKVRTLYDFSKEEGNAVTGISD